MFVDDACLGLFSDILKKLVGTPLLSLVDNVNVLRKGVKDGY